MSAPQQQGPQEEQLNVQQGPNMNIQQQMTNQPPVQTYPQPMAYPPPPMPVNGPFYEPQTNQVQNVMYYPGTYPYPAPQCPQQQVVMPQNAPVPAMTIPQPQAQFEQVQVPRVVTANGPRNSLIDFKNAALVMAVLGLLCPALEIAAAALFGTKRALEIFTPNTCAIGKAAVVMSVFLVVFYVATLILHFTVGLKLFWPIL